MRSIITLAQQEMGVRAVLDTSGPALVSGAQAAPFLLKPNVHELDALNIGGDGWTASAQALRRAIRRPAGDDYGRPARRRHRRRQGVWEAVPPPITVVSAVGSGDSLTAAFVWALINGYTVPEALRIGRGRRCRERDDGDVRLLHPRSDL